MPKGIGFWARTGSFPSVTHRRRGGPIVRTMLTLGDKKGLLNPFRPGIRVDRRNRASGAKEGEMAGSGRIERPRESQRCISYWVRTVPRRYLEPIGNAPGLDKDLDGQGVQIWECVRATRGGKMPSCPTMIHGKALASTANGPAGSREMRWETVPIQDCRVLRTGWPGSLLPVDR